MFFGLISTIFAGVVTGNWMKEERQEQKDREDARRRKGLYVDKYGNWRHGDTGKKYTTEDGKAAYRQYCEKQEERSQYWEKQYDEIETTYLIPYYHDFIENKHNLTYEEWIIASQDVLSRWYQKYKHMFTQERQKELFHYGFVNKLRK